MTRSDPTRTGGNAETSALRSESDIRQWIIDRLAIVAPTPSGEIDPSMPFSALGVDSVAGVELISDLETQLGRELDPTLLFSAESPAQLASLLASGAAAPRRRRHTLATTAGGSASDDEPIAIVGIGCRFPGASGPAAYWQLLVDGVDAVSEVPAGRWEPDPTMPTEVDRGGFVDGIDQFDPAFFGITQLEADRMDPQQRMLLEVAWESLEDAAVRPSDLRGTDVGVFVGISTNEYSRRQSASPELIDVFFGTGNALSIAANRISYALDLTGPSISVDTACSSSLVAVHMACTSLRGRECSAALAGGANAILTPLLTLNFTGAGVIAPDGRCKTFDASADGIVRGEGAGMVHLKRLSDALADGDRIYAVIDGSATNQDGRSNGLTAPNPEAQIDVFATACATSGIDPLSVDYVEAHGTGTVLGDAMELRSLDAVYGHGRTDDEPLLVGSVKTNIGHLESAAGVAGLIKTALALHHSTIPPTLHYREPNPYLAEINHVRVVDKPVAWDRPGTRRAGVSGFGFGGTNAHVLLSSAPALAEEPPDATGTSPVTMEDGAPIVLPLSGRTAGALAESVARHAAVLAAEPSSARALAAAQALTRDEHPRRLAVVAADGEGIAASLAELAGGRRHGAAIAGDRRSSEPARIVFLFSGQGRAWWPFDPGLLIDPVIASTLRTCDTELREIANFSLLELIRSGEPVLDHERAQPLLFALQIALARRWQGFGVQPDMIIGQSIGEIAAAHVAGAISLSDALEIVSHRGRLMEESNGTGHTAFVDLPAAEVASLITELGVDVTIAAVTAPGSCVVSGPKPDTVTLVDAATDRDVMALVYDVGDIPGHGPLMAPYAEKLTAAVDFLEPRATTVPMISSVTASLLSGESLDAAYWGRNLREQVRLLEAIELAVAEGAELFLEIAPHPVVTFSTRTTLDAIGSDAKVLHTVKQGEPGALALRRSLASAWVAGAEVDWRSVTGQTRPDVAALPSPWDHRRCWFDLTPSELPATRRRSSGWHPLLDDGTAAGNGTTIWQAHDATVAGRSAARSPGTLLELALATVRASTGSDQVVLSNVRLATGLPRSVDLEERSLDPGQMSVSVAVLGGDARWWIAVSSNGSPSVLAEGTARRLDGGPPDLAPSERISVGARPLEHPADLPAQISSVKSDERTAVLQLDVPMPREGTPQWAVGPKLLDIAFDGAAAFHPEAADGPNRPPELRSIQGIELRGVPGPACRAVIDRVSGDLTVVDEWGAAVLEVRGAMIAPSRDGDRLGDLVVAEFEEVASPAAAASSPVDGARSWSVIGGGDIALAKELAAALNVTVVDGPGAIERLRVDRRGHVVAVEPDPTHLVELLADPAVAGVSVDVVTRPGPIVGLLPALRRRHANVSIRSIELVEHSEASIDGEIDVPALVELLGSEDGHDVLRCSAARVERGQLAVIPVPGPLHSSEPAGDRDYDVVWGEDGGIHVVLSPSPVRPRPAASPDVITLRVDRTLLVGASADLGPAGAIAGVAALGEVVDGPPELVGTAVVVVQRGSATRRLTVEASRTWPVSDAEVAVGVLMRMQVVNPDLPAAVERDPAAAAATFEALLSSTPAWDGPVVELSDITGVAPDEPIVVALDSPDTAVEVSSLRWTTSGRWAVIAADDDPLGDLVVDRLRDRGAEVVPLDDPDEDRASLTGIVAIGAAPIEPIVDAAGTLVWLGPSALLLGDRAPDADELSTAAAVERRRDRGLRTTTLLLGDDADADQVTDVLERALLHGVETAVLDRPGIEALRGTTTSTSGWFGLFGPVRATDASRGDDEVVALLAAAPPSEQLQIVSNHLALEIAEIIGLDPAEIEPHEPLDTYGVDSLVGMEMRSRIETSFAYEVPLSELTRSMTTTALAEHLVEQAVPALLARGNDRPTGVRSTDAASIPVMVQRGSGPTMWWIPGIFGTAEVFGPLGQSLEDHDIRALESTGVPVSSVREVAASHLETILAHQPSGPYRIGGYSYGALIAVEIALALESSGADVERVWLLDPPAPFAPDDAESRAIRESRVAALLAAHLTELFGTDPLAVGDLPALAHDVDLGPLVARLAAAGGTWELDRINGYIDHLWSTVVAAVQAMATHRPSGVVTAPTELIVAAHSGLLDSVPGADWADFLGPGNSPITFDTDHVGLLRPQHASAVAEVVRRSLDSTAGRAVDPEDLMTTTAPKTAVARARRALIEKLTTSDRTRTAVGAVGNVYRQADYLLKALGAERNFRRLSTMGEGFIVGENATIASVSEDPSRVRFGDYCMVDGYLNVREFGYFTMGSYSGLGVNTRVDCSGYVEIGNGCGIAEGVYIIDGLHHPMLTEERIQHGIDLFETLYVDAYGPGTETSFVRIEDLAWIGIRAIILSGVTIGRGAVVAGGAVVSQDVPPFTVVAGNPARVVGRIPSMDVTFEDHPIVRERWKDRPLPDNRRPVREVLDEVAARVAARGRRPAPS